ncbi:unnamed protein product [Knipowitschia caucasica]
MSSCCVFGCQNRKNSVSVSKLKFYRIPADTRSQKKRRHLWLNAVRRKDWTETIIRNARVCSAHFITGEASMDAESPDFVPSVFTYKQQASVPVQKIERLARKRRREALKMEQNGHSYTNEVLVPDEESADMDHVPLLHDREEEEAETEPEPMVTQKTYNALSQKYEQLNNDYFKLRTEFYTLKEENQKLKEELHQSHFTFATVKSNAAYLLFLTGLTWTIFSWIMTKLKPSVLQQVPGLELEDHLLLVLMKLRLGLSNRDLAYRFNIFESQVSKIVRFWFPVMASVLKPLIKWPSKGATLKSMPKAFRRNFKRCRCIIDCTEIFIERPSDLTARAQTWSNYKHNNTIKYLVGITPAGAVSFLSTGWGGRVSDKQITLESGFLSNLEPGDDILADRGFLIRDELAAYGATLRIPSFTKGKSQLPAREVHS